MSDHLAPMRRLSWRLFQHDPFGDMPPPKPLDEPHRRWAEALDAAELPSRVAGLIRGRAELMEVDPAIMGRDGHTLVDWRHAKAMAALGHPAALVRAVARVAMRAGKEDKATLDQRVARLAARVYKE